MAKATLRKKTTRQPTARTKKKQPTKAAYAASSVTRTSTGLREALFQQIEALRSGTSDAQESLAVAKLAQQIVNITRVEIEFATKITDATRTEAKMPTPLQLADKVTAASSLN